MCSIFQVAVHAQGDGGVVKFNIGGGVITGGHNSQGLWMDVASAVFAINSIGQVQPLSWLGGVPFDLWGRVLITTINPVFRIAPGAIPFDSFGNIVVAGATTHYLHGIAYSATGALAAS